MINQEPTSCWWIRYTLRRHDKIISAIKSITARVSHEYGVEILTSVAHTYHIDTANGNHLRRNTINKEMGDLKIAFDILSDTSTPPPGYRKASGHIVFDVCMVLERNARWAKDGHKTPEPLNSTFTCVVSCGSIYIALAYASLNGLDVY